MVILYTSKNPDFGSTTYNIIPLLHRSFVSSEKQVMCPNFFSQSVAINPDTKFSL